MGNVQKKQISPQTNHCVFCVYFNIPSCAGKDVIATARTCSQYKANELSGLSEATKKQLIKPLPRR